VETNGTRLRLLWSDIHGIERGKYLYGNWQERGRANFCLATFPLTFDREILPIEGLAFDVGLPHLEATIELAERISIPVIASGGFASIDDVKALLAPRAKKLAGAIAGRALYDGRLDPAAALALIRNARAAA